MLSRLVSTVSMGGSCGLVTQNGLSAFCSRRSGTSRKGVNDLDDHLGPRHGGHRHGYAPRYHYGAPYRSWGYYAPYGYWAAPAFAYPYPVYAPPPVVVERAPPPYYGERVERPVPYRERSYAEAQPAKPAPKAPAAQPMPGNQSAKRCSRHGFARIKA